MDVGIDRQQRRRENHPNDCAEVGTEMRRLFGYVLIAVPVLAFCTFLVCALATNIGFVSAIVATVSAVAMVVSLIIGIRILD